jgi:hypothetical protein
MFDKKAYNKEYNANIPKELRKIYKDRYLATEKGKIYRQNINRRYREKKKLLQLQSVCV